MGESGQTSSAKHEQDSLGETLVALYPEAVEAVKLVGTEGLRRVLQETQVDNEGLDLSIAPCGGGSLGEERSRLPTRQGEESLGAARD